MPVVARPGLRLPSGTCDCHCHVFAPPDVRPLFAGRNYTPSVATLADYVRLMETFGIDRAVLVQPSVYGIDNAVLLEALAALPKQLRGIVVIPPDSSDAELARLNALGVRGVRINRRNPGGLPLAAIGELSRRIAPLGWHLQFLISLEDTPDLADIVARSEVQVVIDHMGFLSTGQGIDARGFQSLLHLAEQGKCWVKLSAPYRMAVRPETLDPFIAALVGSAADRLLWATDWPHSERFDTVPDDADLVELAQRWFSTPELRRRVLIDNPDRLYWYA
jgi:predicted TIM-barrel fold metal-dependent hydrolase